MNIDYKKIKKIRLSKIKNYIFETTKNKDILDICASKLKVNCSIIFLKLENTDKTNLEISQKLRQLCSIYESILIIKHRFDFVKIVEADGILLDHNSIPLKTIKKFLDIEHYFIYKKTKDETEILDDFDLIIE